MTKKGRPDNSIRHSGIRHSSFLFSASLRLCERPLLMTDCRLIVDPPQDGARNMALDEALLEEAADHGTATLRFYQWREPTLSLGYFQRYEDRFNHAASRDAAVVRRPSGGGALIHDSELTYSICLPASHPLARESIALYQLVHRAIIEVLAAFDLRLTLHADHPAKIVGESDEPFLCYARRTDADLVLLVAGAKRMAKIVGSAQRRRRGAVLQHGSILLAASSAAPEIPGLNDLSGRSLMPDELVDPLGQELSDALQLQLDRRPLSPDLLKTAQRLQAEKYAHRSWTCRR
jgi:lipoyl(octanoyl) transferase